MRPRPGLVPDAEAARLLFVHAHPDDETLWTGVSIAHHVARGDDVHVLTCTLGEEGEVIPKSLRHLEGAPGDPLAPHRLGELRSALTVLGATSHVLGLGAQGGTPAYRDSGMVGSAAARHPRAWAGAPLADAAAAIGAVLERVRPDVVVTYDPEGGYGHPDHIRTHDATCAAVAASAQPPILYAVVTPRSWALADREWARAHVAAVGGLSVPAPGADLPPSVVDDDLVTHATVDVAAVPLQEQALRAHATQVVVGDRWYALSNGVVAHLSGREGFRRLDDGEVAR